MNKEAIKKWVGSTELPFTPKGNMIVNPESLSKIIHDCYKELSQDQWVSVEDRLPEDGDQVLAFKKASDNREWFYLCDYEDGQFIVPKIGIFEPQLWKPLELPNDK